MVTLAPNLTLLPICAFGPNDGPSTNGCVISDHNAEANYDVFLNDHVGSDADVITELCALIDLRTVADCDIVTASDQFVQCYIGPDLRIITNRNPAVYYGSTTDYPIAAKIRSWRYLDGGGDTQDRQVARSESLTQGVNAPPVEMNVIVAVAQIIRQNECRVSQTIVVGHGLLLLAEGG